MTKAERQLLSLHRTIRKAADQLGTMIRELDCPKAWAATKSATPTLDGEVNAELQGFTFAGNRAYPPPLICKPAVWRKIVALMCRDGGKFNQDGAYFEFAMGRQAKALVAGMIVKDAPAPSEGKNEVIEALKLFTCESIWAYPPTGTRFSPALWVKITRVMQNNGGFWVTGKNRFEFKTGTNVGLILEGMTHSGEIINRKKDLQSFYTPSDVAKMVVGLADVEGHVVLEPSAGDGRLAYECINDGASAVVCYEVDPAACQVLRAQGYATTEGDFLSMPVRPGRYPRIVMNPPFAKKAYIKHIKHALGFLRTNGILVAVIPGAGVPLPSALIEAIGDRTWSCYKVEAGAFKSSGTNIATSVLVIKN